MKVSGFFRRGGQKDKSSFQWAGWLILVIFLAVLYYIGSHHWHVIKLFYFIPLFLFLCLSLIVAANHLTPDDKG